VRFVEAGETVAACHVDADVIGKRHVSLSLRLGEDEVVVSDEAVVSDASKVRIERGERFAECRAAESEQPASAYPQV
jgi:hypothetical protein